MVYKHIDCSYIYLIIIPVTVYYCKETLYFSADWYIILKISPWSYNRFIFEIDIYKTLHK